MTSTIMEEEIEFPPLEAVESEPSTESSPTESPQPKKTRRRRSDAGQSRGPRGVGSRAPRATTTKKLEEDLLVPIAMFAQGISMALPTAGAVLIAEGERTSKAIVAFAATRPKMLAALQRGAQVGPSVELARIGASFILAAAIDLNRMPPDHPAARLTGVTRIYAEMHQHMQQAEEPPPPDPMTGGFDNIQKAPPEYLFDGINPDGTYDAPPLFRAGESAAVRNDE